VAQRPSRRRRNGLAWLVAVGALLVASQAKPVTAPAQPAPTTTPVGSPRAGLAVAYAVSQLGKPYQWGAEGPGSFDCSGLTWAAWRAAGLGWGRMTAADQWRALRAHTVSRTALRPGDLVFFANNPRDWRSIHHVGLYVGTGRMAEAPHRNARVRLASIDRAGWFGAARPTTTGRR
jgi:cell wall-associated NlpC family hydrolase